MKRLVLVAALTVARCVALVFTLMIVLVSIAPPASAHTRLVASVPAGGATVTEAPAVIRLEFDGTIESSFGGVQVFDPAGLRVEEQAPPTIRGRVVELVLTPIEEAGTYTVVFRVISADGHPVEARYSFLFEPPVQATTTSTSPAPRVDPNDIELDDAGRGSDAGLWLSRALNYLSLSLLIGFLLATVVFLARGDDDAQGRARARMGALVAGAALAISGLCLFAFGLSNAAARGLPGVLTGELIVRYAETRFGRLVLAQVVLAVAATGLVALSRRRRRLATAGLAVAGLAGLAPALWGHAGSDDLRVVAITNDWLHVLGVTAWTGGLAALAVLVLGRSNTAVANPARRFSRLAGWALFVTLVTGVVNALLHLGGVGQLTDTRWGKLVIVKAVLFALLTTLGYLARNRMLPQLHDGGGRSRTLFVRQAAAELALMLLAFGAATQMANGIPADAEAASRVESIAVAFGAGQLNVSVEPARAGVNVVHIYVLDATGRIDGTAREATATLIRGNQRIEANLVLSGPGHWSALNQRIPTSGEWIIRVTARTASGDATASGAVRIR